LYFNFFLVSFCITFLSDCIATSNKYHCYQLHTKSYPTFFCLG
jgi:hypothetical protein